MTRTEWLAAVAPTLRQDMTLTASDVDGSEAQAEARGDYDSERTRARLAERRAR